MMGEPGHPQRQQVRVGRVLEVLGEMWIGASSQPAAPRGCQLHQDRVHVLRAMGLDPLGEQLGLEAAGGVEQHHERAAGGQYGPWRLVRWVLVR